MAAIPCYNTEKSIGNVVSEAKKRVDQVVVIDDGSSDNTAAKAKSLGALVIRHASNKGYGEAIKSCMQVAKANFVDVLVTLDGDGQHNPQEIPYLVEPITHGLADMVIGSRFLNHRQNIPSYRRFGITVITYLWNFGSKIKVSDSQSGFRAYAKRILETLSVTEKGMSVSIEIIEQGRRLGARIEEVPITCYYGPSTFGLKAIRHGLDIALSVIRIRLKNRHRLF